MDGLAIAGFISLGMLIGVVLGTAIRAWEDAHDDQFAIREIAAFARGYRQCDRDRQKDLDQEVDQFLDQINSPLFDQEDLA